MYKVYCAEPGGIEFSTEEECRRYELAVEALAHICKEAGEINLFVAQDNDEDECSGDEDTWCRLSLTAADELAKKYNINLLSILPILQWFNFSWIANPDFDKIIAIYNDIQAYIRTAEEIDEYIGDGPSN